MPEGIAILFGRFRTPPVVLPSDLPLTGNVNGDVMMVLNPSGPASAPKLYKWDEDLVGPNKWVATDADLSARITALEPPRPASVWTDVTMPGTALSTGANVRAPSMGRFRRDVGNTTEGVWAYRFNRVGTVPFVGQTKELFFSFQVIHEYARSQDLHLHLHWSPGPSGAVVGNVGWKIEYTVAKGGAAFPVTQVFDLTDACSGVDYDHQITPAGVIPGGTLEESSIVMCRIFRDTDTWAADDGFLLSVDLHVPVNKPGTRLEMPPWD